MAFIGIGINSIEEKVQQKLIYDAQKQKQQDKKAASKKKSEEKVQKAQWKEAKKLYEQKRDEAAKKIADRMMKTWEDVNKVKRQMTQAKETPEAIEKAKKVNYGIEADDITNILNQYNTDIDNYIEKAKELKPKIAPQITQENQRQRIMTIASDDFQKRVKMQMEMAKKLAKSMSLTQLTQFDTDKINQELSNIPLKIEETIDQVKTLFDTLLGKIVVPVFNPDLPEFDIDALIAQIKVFLNPVIASTAPLTAILGKIPILGDISSMLQMLSSGSGSGQPTLTKDQIMKILPKKPELDPTLKDKALGIMSDVTLFVMTLPTLLIQVIFAMIDVIYSKLKIITSVIPLGGMFPLSLLPAAIDSTPKILTLMKTLPGMLWDCVVGLIKDKLWEAMALAFPKPNIDTDSLVALAEDINEQNAAKKSKAEKRKDYTDVTREVFANQLSSQGYTLMQAKTIQKNYKAIYNGTDTTQTEITEFVDNGKDQNLPNATWNSFSGAGTQLDESKLEAGFTETKIIRKKPSTEDYEAYIKKLISESDLSVGLNYERIKPTQNVIGEWYETFKDQLQKYGDEVVLKDTMKPARTGWSWSTFDPTRNRR